MKWLTAVSALAILLVALAACSVFGAESNGKRLNLNLEQVPFPEVIRQIFSGSKDRYSVDAELNNLKVSATLKNVTRQQALLVVTKTAGVTFSVQNGAYAFFAEPQMVARKGPANSSPAAAIGPVKFDTITVQYIGAGDAASLLNASPPDGLMMIVATSVNTLLLKGDAAGIEQAKNIVKVFDVEAALPHSVRVALSLKISAAGLKNPINLTTESVGPEGAPMPLSTNSSGEQGDNIMLTLTLTPTVLPDGSISLTGSGGVDCSVPGVGQNAQRMSKSFEVGASASSGTSTIIASGSTETGVGKMEFTVSATATVEKGRLAMPKGGLSAPGPMSVQRPQSIRSSIDAASKPDDAHRKAADALLQQIWRAESGQPTFDAIGAVVRSYNEGDAATRNAIAWLCLTYMKDSSREVMQRWPCCYVISGSRYEPGIPDLIDVLLHDSMETMRAVAAEALGGVSYNAAAHDALLQAKLKETSKRVLDVIAKYVGPDGR